MNRRAIIEVFIDKFLESFDHLRRNIGIEFDDYAAVIGCFDHRDLRISHGFDAGLDVPCGWWVAVEVFAGRRI